MSLEAKDFACQYLDNKVDDLKEISKCIWENPELSFKEFKAHDLLTSFLEKEGFDVSKKTPLETSFIAKYGKNDGLKIAIICEYDALPGIGHACGHNLIAEAGIAAALGIKAVLKSKPSINASLTVFGTPAEEDGGGKILMIQQGVFKNIDICMMSHPGALNIISPTIFSSNEVKIQFKGKASHAAAAPWEGINALDAAVACYNNVSMLRQQIKPTDRIHMIITNGGEKPNIIPEKSELQIEYRSTSNEGRMQLKDRIKACAQGAALATGCGWELNEAFEIPYESLNSNKTLEKLYKENAKSFGLNFVEIKEGVGSTDMGNVSSIVPSIHPVFRIKTNNVNHTKEFTEASILDENQLPTIISGKCMAMTAIDIMFDSSLLEQIKNEFAKTT